MEVWIELLVQRVEFLNAVLFQRLVQRALGEFDAGIKLFSIGVGGLPLDGEYVLRQIAQYTATGRYDQPTVEDRYRMIRAYFQMLLDESEASAGDKNAAVREVARDFDWATSVKFFREIADQAQTEGADPAVESRSAGDLDMG